MEIAVARLFRGGGSRQRRQEVSDLRGVKGEGMRGGRNPRLWRGGLQQIAHVF